VKRCKIAHKKAELEKFVKKSEEKFGKNSSFIVKKVL
tara:strand:+ start:818 stop:928 length:111 start_codon:yes stop_codon:yes gene_type:complete